MSEKKPMQAAAQADGTAPNEKEEIVQTMKQIRKSSVILSILVLIVLILFATFIWQGTQQVDQSGITKTFDELYDQTLAGQETEHNYLYDTFVFIYDKNEDLWKTRLGRHTPTGYDEFTIPFYYDPRQASSVAYTNGTIHALHEKDRVYLTVDPEENGSIIIATIEVGRITGRLYQLLDYETIAAVTRDAPEGRPAITCANVTDTDAVVHFRTGNTTAVYEENGCVIVQGTTIDEVIKAADRFTYALLGIMPDPTPIPFEPIATGVVNNVTVDILDTQLTSALSAMMDGRLFKDEPTREAFLVTLVRLTNTGNETVEYKGLGFGLEYENESVLLDFSQQRFLSNKVGFENTLRPGQTRMFQLAFDVERVFTTMNMSVKFWQAPKGYVTFPVILE